MSELSSQLLRTLTDAIAATGAVDRPRAAQLAALNATMPIIEGDEWVVGDETGAPILRLPAPKPLII